MMLKNLLIVFLVARGVVCYLFTVTGVKDQVVNFGHNVTFSCEVEHYTFLSLHLKNFNLTWWHTPVNSNSARVVLRLHSGAQSVEPRIIEIADRIKYVPSNFDLTIRDAEFQDAGLYNCSFEFRNQVDNDSADLFVLLPPTCRNLKPSLSIHIDEQTFFDCVVHYHGNKPPLLLWKHDQQELSSKANRHNDSCVISTLSFRADTKYNGYRFQCIVEYPSAMFQSTCETSPPLQIYYPVHVTEMLIEPHADKYIYKEGENIMLDCLANGNPQPRYSWYFNPKGDNFKHIKLVTEHRYRIFNAKERDEGIYNCTVTNVVNGTLYNDSKTIYINIKDQSDNTGSYHFVLVADRNSSVEPVQATTSANVSPYAIGAIICAILAVVLIIVLVILALKFKDQCYLREMRNKPGHQWTSHDQDENMDDQEVELLDESVQSRMSNDEPGYGRLKLYWEIPRKDIRLVDQIGTGRFVEVWKGKMKRYQDSTEVQKVAIKKIKDNANEEERKFFLDEMEVQKMLQPHPNVILLIGCYTFHEPWLLMLELAQEGTLMDYLLHGRPDGQEVEITSNSVRHKNINSHKLLALAAQIVNGLMHLLKFKLIYYRLKSSNILVGRGGICKLSRFGFPHEITERNLYEKDNQPIQWMSPESIKQDIFNYRTDIWSYGVLLWEIVHFGLTPYPGLDPAEVKEKILSGETLPHPPHCSEDLYALMSECWHEEPVKRKEYETILNDLSILASNHTLHIMMDRFLDGFNSQPVV